MSIAHLNESRFYLGKESVVHSNDLAGASSSTQGVYTCLSNPYDSIFGIRNVSIVHPNESIFASSSSL